MRNRRIFLQSARHSIDIRYGLQVYIYTIYCLEENKVSLFLRFMINMLDLDMHVVATMVAMDYRRVLHTNIC